MQTEWEQNEERETVTITGAVEEVIFKNDENGYAILVLDVSGREYVTVVGYLPYISEGENITVQGQWTFHAEYGRQLKAESYVKNMPKEKADILKYLSSGIVKGVKAATAAKIVDMFGTESLHIIETEPERLAEIVGISKKKAAQIGEAYAQQLGVRDIVLFLQKYDISPAFAVRVYQRYGLASVEVIQNNPYILADEIYGISFRTADAVALKMGVERNSVVRIQSAVLFLLHQGAANGHTYLPRGILITEVCKLIGVADGEVENAVNGMLFNGRICNEITDAGENIYLKYLYEAERDVAVRLAALSKVRFARQNFDVEKIIAQVEQEERLEFAAEQKKAILTAMDSGVLVITGGPGTGKTTIINAVIRIMKQLEKEIYLAAPTGRAAKRMTELCGMEAKTIHRLLEVNFTEEERMDFARGEDKPLECDVLILDEMSMVDILLLNSVLKALKNGTRLIMVGDSDQLPSVGAGDVLRSIMESGLVPVVRLTEIFRQARESAIVTNAHAINHGQYPVFNQKDSDCFIDRCANAEEILQRTVDLCRTRLPRTYGFDSTAHIQVLSPTRKGLVGVASLNEKLQAALNPPAKGKKEKTYRNVIFREGDKVMQTKNNYMTEWETLDGAEQGMGVFNGDVGFITSIDFDLESIQVVFDDRCVQYPFAQLEELELAYALTVHKSQGNEFDAVVIPMYPCAPMLMNRNLLYTAVTRAKQLVVFVGREDVVHTMVDNESVRQRYCGLARKMRALL